MTEAVYAADASSATGRSEFAMPTTNDEWIARLRTPGRVGEHATRLLRELLVRAAAHQVHRVAQADRLGAARIEEIVNSAANEATIAVLAKLDAFEGRSKFTTWVFKFGILHANAETRRAMWKDREVSFAEDFDIASDVAQTPEARAETQDLLTQVRRGLNESLTERQRMVATALLIDEVPIDVLAERLETNRNALYKTLHDARKRLREFLASQGIEPGVTFAHTKEVVI